MNWWNILWTAGAVALIVAAGATLRALLRKAWLLGFNECDKLYTAANPSTLPEELVRLAAEGDANVRLCVASNPATPPDARARLANDADPNVREAARARKEQP